METRIYLTGRVALESRGDLLIEERHFRGRQARLAFAYLVMERTRPVPRWELAAALWPREMPPAWETGLAAILSRIRKLLAPLGPEAASLSSGFEQYQLRFPGDVWVDIEAATSAVDEAEGALRAGDPKKAFGPATAAAAIARRPFLSGHEGEWAESQRRKLERVLLRALDCLASVWLASGEAHLAVEAASDAARLDSFRESSYRLLMQAHLESGNRAEALRVYHRLREHLTKELGADPSAETEALYLRLLS